MTPHPLIEPPCFHAAAEAEAAFYHALAHADLDAMMAVWSEDDEVACILPNGNRLDGIEAIREGWRQHFAHRGAHSMRTSARLVASSMVLEIRSVVQHIGGEGDNDLPTLSVVLATNVYSRGPRGWRMILHHACAAPENAGTAGQTRARIVH